MPSAGASSDGLFDCIIMNPPFAGRAESLHRVSLVQVGGQGSGRCRYAPLEASFVLRGIELLRPKGRLLAILPGSLVCSNRTSWFREFLLEAGSVLCVHELPGRTFPGVESRVYLVVFEKRRAGRLCVLSNHDLSAPESVRVRMSEESPDFRLDYGFHAAKRRLAKLRGVGPNWRKLGEECIFHRGTEASPTGPLYAVHTCDYEGGFWRRSPRHKQLSPNRDVLVVERGDLLMKHVGRGCASSLGVPVELIGVPCSDCMFILRPSRVADRTRLLFAVRVCLGGDLLAALVERGTGASYVAEGDLLNLAVPLDLAEKYPRPFAQYRTAVSRHRFQVMMEIEQRIRRDLLLRVSRGEP